jgi:DNA-binding transcriptional MerR regulator
MLRIGEFATLAHASVKTLRFYDETGVFRPAYTDRCTRYRYYTAGQIAQLATIRRLRSFGVSLSEIRDFMSHRADTNRLSALLLTQRAGLERRVRDEERRLAELDHWMAQLEVGRDRPPYQIAVKRIDACRVAVVRESIRRYSDAAGLFDELRHHVRRRGSTRGLRAAIWHTCGDTAGPVDCEAFLVAARPIASTPRIRVCDWPSTLVASVVCQGKIDMSPGPYSAAREWIASHGYRVTASKREIYWAGDVDGNGDSDLTEIQFPIARV